MNVFTNNSQTFVKLWTCSWTVQEHLPETKLHKKNSWTETDTLILEWMKICILQYKDAKSSIKYISTKLN